VYVNFTQLTSVKGLQLSPGGVLPLSLLALVFLHFKVNAAVARAQEKRESGNCTETEVAVAVAMAMAAPFGGRESGRRMARSGSCADQPPTNPARPFSSLPNVRGEMKVALLLSHSKIHIRNC